MVGERVSQLPEKSKSIPMDEAGRFPRPLFRLSRLNPCGAVRTVVKVCQPPPPSLKHCQL